MGCSSCQQNNHVVPTTTSTSATQSYCDCACGCNEPICPTPQPCTEITDSKCIVYTDEPIKCGNDTIVTTNASVSTALNQITNFFCENLGTGGVIPNDIVCGTTVVVAQNTSFENAFTDVVNYFCNNTPPPVSSGLVIPALNITTKGGKKVFASILPGTHSNQYLNYNPKIFLFVKKNGRKRKVKDINGDPQSKYYYGGWKHTTHLQGINFPNGNFYSGITACPTHSEFPLTSTGPYDHQELTTFNPGEFYTYNFSGYYSNVPAPIINGNVIPWTNRDKIAVRGRRDDDSPRSNYFRFAIGIENPDTTSPYPILFGPMSASIQCKLVRFVSFVSYVLNNDPANIKRNIMP